MPPCPCCSATHVIRFGRLRNGHQRYRCRDCLKTFCLDCPGRETPAERKRAILEAYDDLGSMRGVARLYGVSRNTLSVWLKAREEIE